MADSLSPDQIAQRTFRRGLRGYDPQEVEAFLEEVAGSIRDLESRHDALHTRLLELGNRDLTAEFDLISEDVGRILQDAREAAEGMRKRAAGDAEALTEEAQATAVELRSDSWTTGEKLLQDSKKEAAGIVEAAERDSLAIIGEAEREAHRRLSAVRRESEETVRAAKLEAERVLMDARARSDELVQEAERRVEAAQERAAGVEDRRTEMLAELESARQTIGNLESEIEKRREALAGPSPAEVESSTVKLLTTPEQETTDSDEGAVWAEGTEVVKIVRPLKRIVEPPAEPVDADAMAAEVARLRAPGTEPEVLVTEPTEPSEDPSAAAPVVDEAHPAVEPVSADTEIDDLFARLRRVEQATPPPVPAEPETTDEPPPEAMAAEPSAPAIPQSAEAAGPFDLRDRLLLPIANRVLRAVKRELTEAQNIALEELRVESGNWRPNAVTLTERLLPSIEELIEGAYAAGWAAVAEETETELTVPVDRQGDSAEQAGGFAETLTDAVSEALAESQRDGHGPRQLAASLSRVYRFWRTDEAERKIHDMASRAYHGGIVDGSAAAGRSASQWMVGDRGCATCREAAAAGAVPLGSAFEDAVTAPPAHDGCDCTLVPA